jgi:HPt (histidine-containing phosphotransfer) domain-containing protein
MHLDSGALHQLSETVGPQTTATVVRLFIAETRKHFAQLEAIGSSGTEDDQRRIVHKLRGGGLELGTEDLTRLCDALETELRRSPRPLREDELEQLRASVRDTLLALECWLGGSTTPE